MNSHLAYLQEQDARRQDRRRGRVLRTWGYALLLTALCSLAFGVVSSTPIEVEEDLAQETIWEEIPWNLMLVNEENPVPQDFTAELATLEGITVDARMAPLLEELLAKARGEGISLTLCSGYRTAEQQERLYQNAQARGTAQWGTRDTQPPGSSEHQIGLAVDFLTKDCVGLSQSFAQTAASAWLDAHAAEYGFILRYPKEQEGVTGVVWEPWHYRYVGPEAASYLKAFSLTLEEYHQAMQEKTSTVGEAPHGNS